MKSLEILELVKKQLFMTEKGLVSIETLADKAIAEVEAMQERIKELEEALKPKTCDGCAFNFLSPTDIGLLRQSQCF